MRKKYGILAYPVAHSLSPAMFMAAFKAMKIDAEYKPYGIKADELDDFMEIARRDFAGLSVSLPYKEVAMKYLDKIDADAEKIGAVNTIVNENGILTGYNTDFIGSNKAITEVFNGLSIKGRVAVVIGAGGAARAIVYGLLSLGVSVWIKNRTKSKADAIAIEFAELFEAEIHSEEWDNWNTGDILINATSCWHGGRLPQSTSRLGETLASATPVFCDEVFVKKFKVVMDIGYKPLITPLLSVARELGLDIVTGEKMLLYQAVEQFKLWTGKKAPVEVMRGALVVP